MPCFVFFFIVAYRPLQLILSPTSHSWLVRLHARHVKPSNQNLSGPILNWRVYGVSSPPRSDRVRIQEPKRAGEKGFTKCASDSTTRLLVTGCFNKKRPYFASLPFNVRSEPEGKSELVLSEETRTAQVGKCRRMGITTEAPLRRGKQGRRRPSLKGRDEEGGISSFPPDRAAFPSPQQQRPCS